MKRKSSRLPHQNKRNVASDLIVRAICTMRTTIAINDALYQKALELADLTLEKAYLFREAISTFARVQAGKRLAALGGVAPAMPAVPRRREAEASK